MKVTLEKLRLSYFKGIKSLNMEFSPESNNIYGANATGKTTVFDSIWFLFFGKDSTGRADFSIKTMDENNNFIEKVDHEVYAEFSIDGISKSFQRTYKQQWSKDNVLKGHTTAYEIDGFPVRLEKEFQQQIQEYFQEDTFKLLTNPLYFNSMKPADKRNTLIAMASEFGQDQIMDQMPSKTKKSKGFQLLSDMLTQGAALDQIRAKAKATISKYKEEKNAIPDRIDEAERSKPEAYAFDELQEIISDKKTELAEIEQELIEASNQDQAKNKAIQAINNQIFEAKTTLQKLEFQAEQEYNKWKNEQEKTPNELKNVLSELQNKSANLESKIKDNESSILRKKAEIQSIETLIPAKNQQREKLAEEWKKINSSQFEWNGSTCPACERPLDGDQALDAEEQARNRFNADKRSKLDEIEHRGTTIKSTIERLKQDIENLNDSIRNISNAKSDSEESLNSCKEDLINIESAINEWYSTPSKGKDISDFLPKDAAKIKAKIIDLESSKPEEIKSDTSEVQERKQAVINDLESLHKALANKETIERTDKRIDELKHKEKELAQAIAEQEGLEEAAFQFSKSKVEMIEKEINSKFQLVSFKLFETMLNGNEKEICETLYKGVPFNDLNNAGKIQAGLDIINGLSKHYNTYLPIFIDNRESVTWIPMVQSQLINLVVDANYKELSLMAVIETETV